MLFKVNSLVAFLFYYQMLATSMASSEINFDEDWAEPENYEEIVITTKPSIIKHSKTKVESKIISALKPNYSSSMNKGDEKNEKEQDVKISTEEAQNDENAEKLMHSIQKNELSRQKIINEALKTYVNCLILKCDSAVESRIFAFLIESIIVNEFVSTNCLEDKRNQLNVKESPCSNKKKTVKDFLTIRF